MPLNDDERRALQAHSKRYYDYKARYDEERQRLQAPFRRRYFLIDPSNWTARPSGRFQNHIVKHYVTMIQTGLDAFEATHQPEIVPFDTPLELKNFIAHISYIWSPRLGALMHSESDPTTEQSQSEQRRQLSPRWQAAHERVMAFAALAPSVLHDCPVVDEPRIGLQWISAWCDDALREPTSSPSPGSPPARRGRRPDPDIDRKQDERIVSAWDTGSYDRYTDLDREMKLPKGETQRALDRCRKK